LRGERIANLLLAYDHGLPRDKPEGGLSQMPNGLPSSLNAQLHSLSIPPMAMSCESYGVVFHADGFARLSLGPA
jgi:hypothetical protein